MGDYHLSGCPGSPACNLGAANRSGVSAPATDFDDQGRPALGGFDAGADESGATVTPPVSSDLYFSTFGNTNPPGVTGTADDADIYKWDGTAYSRAIDVSAAPYNVPGGANVDGFARVDATHFYASFNGGVTLPGLGGVADEDVVYFDNGTWRLWFDGSANGVGGTDLDAVSVVGNTLYFSTDDTDVPPGAGGSGDDADVYRWNGGSSFTRVVDASALGWSTANVDGLSLVDADHLYLSYSVNTTVPGGLGTVQDEDVVYRNAGAWSVFFDGTAARADLGQPGPRRDLVRVRGAPAATPAPAGCFVPVLLDARGQQPPGRDWNRGQRRHLRLGRQRVHQGVRRVRIRSGAVLLVNVDGYSRVDDTHFYLSFSDAAFLTGLGFVQDEDVVYYDAGTWSMFFDGSTHGLGGSGNLDLDAISVAGSTVYFSTLGNTMPPGCGRDRRRRRHLQLERHVVRPGLGRQRQRSGAGRRTSTGSPGSTRPTSTSPSPRTRRCRASARSRTRTWCSTTTVPWSVYFDGTAHGLTSSNLDVDAFDVP